MFKQTVHALQTDWVYANNYKTTSINDLRYELFVAKKGQIEAHQLPPCCDALYKQCQHDDYQIAIRLENWTGLWEDVVKIDFLEWKCMIFD